MPHVTLQWTGSDVYTSALSVPVDRRFNIGIKIGSAVSAPAVSAASATVILERRHGQYLDSSSDGYYWRRVEAFALAAANGLADEVEVRRGPEPEDAEYRLGVALFSEGQGSLRLGTE